MHVIPVKFLVLCFKIVVIYSIVCSIHAMEVGEPCANSKECTSSNCFCEGTNETNAGSLGVCSCNVGFYHVQSENTCDPIIGASCSDDPFICSSIDADCFQEICECPQGLIFHPKQLICMDKAQQLYSACSQVEDCDLISNAICGDENTCNCPETHFANSNSNETCTPVPILLYGACDFDEDCKNVNNTVCDDASGQSSAWGSCVCAENFKPNENEEACIAKVCPEDISCTPDFYCDSTGECLAKKSLGTGCLETLECLPQFSECRNNICECSENYKPDDSSGMCVPKICDLDFTCNDQQYCENEVCNPKKQLGGTCTITIQCRGNSECGLSGDGTLKCQCPKDFKPNPDVQFPAENVCIPMTCQVDFRCDNGSYCDLNGVCQLLKPINSLCNSSLECSGVNVDCIDSLSTGIKTCSCPQFYVPDRPISDPNVECIRLVENVICQGVDVYGIKWTAFPGTLVSRNCPGEQIGLVYWRCHSNGYFIGAQPDYNNCSTQWVLDLDIKLQELLKTTRGGIISQISRSRSKKNFIAAKIVDRESRMSICSRWRIGNIELKQIGNKSRIMGDDNSSIGVTNASIFFNEMGYTVDRALLADIAAFDEDDKRQFFGHEIKNLIDLIEVVILRLSNLNTDDTEILETNNTGLETITGEALTISDKLLKFSRPWNQLPTEERTKSFVRLLSVIDTSGFQLAIKVNDTNFDFENSREYSKTYEMRSFTISSGIANAGPLKFPLGSREREGKDSFIQLPSNWQNYIQERTTASKFVGMQMGIEVARKNIPAQILDLAEVRIVDSKSLNADLMGISTSEDIYEYTILGDGRVRVIFRHDSDSWGNQPKRIPRTLFEGEKPKSAGGTLQCVLFDTGLGVWTASGCNRVEGESGPYSTTCSCDRLAKYALMSEFHEYPGKTPQYQAVTIVGYGGSCLLQSYRLYQSNSEKECLQLFMKKIMMISLIIGNVILVAFVDRDYFNFSDGMCYVVGMLSHLFALCAFMLVLLVGIDMYFFPTSKNKLVKSGENNNTLEKNVNNTNEENVNNTNEGNVNNTNEENVNNTNEGNVNNTNEENVNNTNEKNVNNANKEKENSANNGDNNGKAAESNQTPQPSEPSCSFLSSILPQEIMERINAFEAPVLTPNQINYLLFGIGIPVFIIVTTATVGATSGDNTRVYGGDFCWLDGPYIWSFFAPAIATFIINVLLLLLFVMFVQQEQNKWKAESNNEDDQNYLTKLESDRTSFLQNVAFVVLLACTWTAGYYQLGPNYSDSPVAQYSFPILTALQGIFIYWFHNGSEGLFSKVFSVAGMECLADNENPDEKSGNTANEAVLSPEPNPTATNPPSTGGQREVDANSGNESHKQSQCSEGRILPFRGRPPMRWPYPMSYEYSYDAEMYDYYYPQRYPPPMMSGDSRMGRVYSDEECIYPYIPIPRDPIRRYPPGYPGEFGDYRGVYNGYARRPGPPLNSRLTRSQADKSEESDEYHDAIDFETDNSAKSRQGERGRIVKLERSGNVCDDLSDVTV